MKNRKSLKKTFKITKGFTLAEVLITLGIIGVVVAMTLPTVVNSYRAKELETRFKKAYSVIWNVHQRMMAEHDGVYKVFIQKDLSGADQALTTTLTALKYEYINNFKKYIQNGKFCDYENSYLACSNKSNPIKYKTYTGNREAYFNQDVVNNRAIVTADGLTFFFGSPKYRNARIYVDTNGNTKGPNRLGFDVFAFDIDQTDRIVPAKNTASNVDDDGNSVAVNECSVYKGNTIYNGFGCSKYALMDKNPDDPNLSYWQHLPK